MTARQSVIEQKQIWLTIMLSQAASAIRAMGEAGIPCLLLKGGAGLLAGWLKVGDRPVTDIRALLEHPNVRMDWDRVERTAQNYRVAPIVAAGLQEVKEEAPDSVSDEICERLRRLPIRRIDRVLSPVDPPFSRRSGPWSRGDRGTGLFPNPSLPAQ